MARGAAQAKRKAAKAQPGRRRQAAARRPPTIEQTMFFPRLRRQAKWVFLALAFVFAGGFVFFGVGSGSTGLGDLLRGNFNIFGSNGGSTNSSAVKSALKKTHAHPKDPNAWNALATAYSSDGRLSDANKAYEHVLKLRPNDTSALQNVANYYETRAQDKATVARSLQAQISPSLATVLGVSANSKIGQAFANDPTTQQLTQRVNTAVTEYSAALQKDLQLLKRLAKLQPTDVNTQFHYGFIADQAGDTTAAIAAYKKVVRLAPSDPSAQQARQRIAILSAATPVVKHR